MRRSMMVAFGLVGIAAATLLWIGFDDDLALRTRELRTQRHSERAGSVTEDIVELRSGDRSVGHVTVELFRGPSKPGLVRVHLRTPPDLAGRSLRFTLRTPDLPPPRVALRTPGGWPWPPISYHTTRDGGGVRVEVADLGFQGRGSTTLELAVLDPPPEDWQVDLDVVLQRADPPTLQRYHGAAQLTLRNGDPPRSAQSGERITEDR